MIPKEQKSGLYRPLFLFQHSCSNPLADQALGVEFEGLRNVLAT